VRGSVYTSALRSPAGVAMQRELDTAAGIYLTAVDVLGLPRGRKLGVLMARLFAGHRIIWPCV